MSTYPLPKFHFKVAFGAAEFNCSEVSGLDFEAEIIEYRSGDSPDYFKTKQPGLRKFSNNTLKRGTFVDSHNEWYDEWVKTVYLQEGAETFRGDLTISLLDETHMPVVTWKASSAYITKIQSTDLKADGNEIAFQTAEFAHEKLEKL